MKRHACFVKGHACLLLRRSMLTTPWGYNAYRRADARTWGSAPCCGAWVIANFLWEKNAFYRKKVKSWKATKSDKIVTDATTMVISARLSQCGHSPNIWSLMSCMMSACKLREQPTSKQHSKAKHQHATRWEKQRTITHNKLCKHTRLRRYRG